MEPCISGPKVTIYIHCSGHDWDQKHWCRTILVYYGSLIHRFLLKGTDRWFIQSPAKYLLQASALFQTLSAEAFPNGSVKQTIWCVESAPYSANNLPHAVLWYCEIYSICVSFLHFQPTAEWNRGNRVLCSFHIAIIWWNNDINHILYLSKSKITSHWLCWVNEFKIPENL